MDRLYLPNHAWFYFCGKTAVITDLRNDFYAELNEEQCAALRELIANGGATNQGTSRALEELISHGLLTSQAAHARPVAPTTLAAASTPLLEDDVAAPGKIGVREFVNFFYACIRVRLQLRRGGLYAVLSHLKRLRSRTHKRQVSGDRLLELVGAFRTLRPWYPKEYVCLFDTLALLEFLARYGAFPYYVLGYIRSTTEGHCWAQFDNRLILDDPEFVTRFTPIAVI